LPPIAVGIVTPGVHVGAPETALQVFPIAPPDGVQFEPLQQRLGRGAVWGVHVRLGAQPPVESQRQPWVPTMQVVGAPAAEPVPPSFVPPSPFPNEEPPSPTMPPLEVGSVNCDDGSDPQLASTIHSVTPTPPRPKNCVGFRIGRLVLSDKS
jgi:hypothetical protein